MSTYRNAVWDSDLAPIAFGGPGGFRWNMVTTEVIDIGRGIHVETQFLRAAGITRIVGRLEHESVVACVLRRDELDREMLVVRKIGSHLEYLKHRRLFNRREPPVVGGQVLNVPTYTLANFVTWDWELEDNLPLYSSDGEYDSEDSGDL